MPFDCATPAPHPTPATWPENPLVVRLASCVADRVPSAEASQVTPTWQTAAPPTGSEVTSSAHCGLNRSTRSRTRSSSMLSQRLPRAAKRSRSAAPTVRCSCLPRQPIRPMPCGSPIATCTSASAAVVPPPDGRASMSCTRCSPRVTRNSATTPAASATLPWRPRDGYISPRRVGTHCPNRPPA